MDDVPRVVKAISKDKVLERCGTIVQIDGHDIGIFQRGTEYFAIDNVCAHQHFSLLHKGRLEGLTVECPMHGWTYDLRTGLAVAGDGRVATYNVRVEGDDLLIELPDGWM